MYIERKKLSLIITLMSTFAMLFTPKALAQEPSISIVPSEVVAGPDEKFNVTITAADWEEPEVYSYELYLYYNTTYLNATVAQIPSDHWLKPSLSPYNIFIVDGGTINNTSGVVSFAASLLGDEPGKTGGGVLAQVTFKVIQGPPTGNITTYLKLRNTKWQTILVDPDAIEIPSDNYDINPASVIIPEFTVMVMLIALFAITAATLLLKKKLQ